MHPRKCNTHFLFLFFLPDIVSTIKNAVFKAEDPFKLIIFFCSLCFANSSECTMSLNLREKCFRDLSRKKRRKNNSSNNNKNSKQQLLYAVCVWSITLQYLIEITELKARSHNLFICSIIPRVFLLSFTTLLLFIKFILAL